VAWRGASAGAGGAERPRAPRAPALTSPPDAVAAAAAAAAAAAIAIVLMGPFMFMHDACICCQMFCHIAKHSGVTCGKPKPGIAPNGGTPPIAPPSAPGGMPKPGMPAPGGHAGG
jgi:hypothetical protein